MMILHEGEVTATAGAESFDACDGADRGMVRGEFGRGPSRRTREPISYRLPWRHLTRSKDCKSKILGHVRGFVDVARAVAKNMPGLSPRVVAPAVAL
jgi:hypothetical protein